jgi:class 3 adenylate cyclase
LICTCHVEQVQKIYLPPDLQRAVALCRYAIYAVFGALTVLASFLADELSFNWLALCIVQALVVQGLLRRVTHRVTMKLLYLTEWLWVIVLALVVGLPAAAVASFLLVVLVCHTTLWGGRWCLLTLGCGLICAGLLEQMIGFTLVSNLWVSGVAVTASAVFMLVICSIAHHQVRQQLSYGLLQKQQNNLLLRYLPKELPAHLDTTASLPFQRQWVSVLFVDVVGFTRSVRALPLEELSNLLNRFFDEVHEAVEQWGGSVTKFLGDGALCVFPCPPGQCRSNAARQAVRCAQLLPDRFSQGQTGDSVDTIDVKLSLGLASGHCYFGQWGGARRDFTIIGVPVNLANRLQRSATDHGGLLLDTTTARLARENWLLSSSLTLNLPGFGRREVVSAPLLRCDKQLVASPSFAKVRPP